MPVGRATLSHSKSSLSRHSAQVSKPFPAHTSATRPKRGAVIPCILRAQAPAWRQTFVWSSPESAASLSGTPGMYRVIMKSRPIKALLTSTAITWGTATPCPASRR